MPLKFAWEKLADLLKEPNVKDLVEQHFLEIAEDQEEIPLDIRWDVYLAMEERGALKVSTARSGRQLVGYCCYTIERHPNYPVLYAWDAPFYVHPDFRRGTAGIRLLRWAEPRLKEMGVKRVIRHEKVGSPLWQLFDIMGYRPYERRWCKIL